MTRKQLQVLSSEELRKLAKEATEELKLREREYQKALEQCPMTYRPDALAAYQYDLD
jgi:hypothetical protein